MSGAKIGMVIILRATRRTRLDLALGSMVGTACCAAAAGTPRLPWAAALRPVAATVSAPATTPSASVSQRLRSSLSPFLIP